MNIEDEIICINVSGRCFQTYASTLNRFPKSLLGNKQRRLTLRKTNQDEIFLDRNQIIFENVLTFYQTGVFEQPNNVAQAAFVNDIGFYGLNEEAKECGLKGFNKIERELPSKKWEEVIWCLLEYPDSSLGAKIVSIFSLSVILISIVVFCLETLPAYKDDKGTSSVNNTTSIIQKDEKVTTGEVLDAVEMFCIAWFTLEFTSRFISSPRKIKFICSFLNLIDICSIVPFYITLFGFFEQGISIHFLRVIRLARVFRIFKLSRHSGEMKILGIALRESVRELGVLVFFIALGVLIFSSAVYYAEQGQADTPMTSIPGAFWWSIVTMTTVGYGDEIPKSGFGRIVGASCAMTGILVIALPIPIIVNNFTRQYSRLKPATKYSVEFLDLSSKKDEKMIRLSYGKKISGESIRMIWEGKHCTTDNIV